MSRRGGPPARRQQSSHPGPLLGGRRHPQSRETGAQSLQAAGRQSLSSKGPEPFGVSAGSVRGARVGVHHNLGGAQLWVSAALGEGGSQGATDHPGARSPGLRGERPGPLEGAGEAMRAPRADSASHLGRGAAVQEFGVSWESRGGGEDGSGRRSGDQDPRPMPGCRPLLRSGPGPAQVLRSSAPRGHALGPQERRARAVPASGRSSPWRQLWAVTARPALPREGLSGPVIVAVRG